MYIHYNLNNLFWKDLTYFSTFLICLPFLNKFTQKKMIVCKIPDPNLGDQRVMDPADMDPHILY